MKNGDLVTMTVAVARGSGIVIEAPEEVWADLDGHFCEDNRFSYVPDRPGIYRVEARYWETYLEHDGEADSGYTVMSVSRLVLEDAPPPQDPRHTYPR